MSPRSISAVEEALYSFFAHAKFAHALTLIIFVTAFAFSALRSLLGTPGIIALLCAELVLAAAMLLARRRMISWVNFIPLTVAAFVTWLVLSYLWSYYPGSTMPGIGLQLALMALGLAIAASRDTIQVVRSLGDVFRVLLGASLILEILSGIVLDMPFGFLGIKGHITTGDGIQGLFASRNAVSVICVIALVTFFIEWKTRSVSASLAAGSLIGATLCLWLAASPVGFVTAVVVAAGYGILNALRKLPASSRRGVNIGLLSVGLVSVVAAWAFRGAVIQFLSGSPVMQYRLTLWNELGRIAQMKFLEGWGWVGIWPKKTQPFTVMVNANTTPNSSGLNIYLDVWLQLGLIGLVLFLILLGFAFVRSWRSATTKRSDVFLWSPLILIALLVSGLAESSALTLWGWLLVVIIASQNSPEKLTRASKKEAVTA